MPRVKPKRPKVRPRYGWFWVWPDGHVYLETARGATSLIEDGYTVRRLLISEPPKRKGKR